MQTGNNKKNIEVAIAVIAWLSVILQFVLIIINRIAPVPETIVRFFSYYTILTNVLVAAAFTSLTGAFGEKWKQFFLKATNFTAVTVYITVVCITYNVVLRGLVELTGLQRLVDEMLHLVIPIFVLLYWFIVFSSSSLQWKDAFNWMWYPLVYCMYVLIRGAYSGFYPYPFMNVTELGYSSVFINCIYVTVAFFVVALLLIGFSKVRMKKTIA
jgi:hypothetical protein